MPSRILVTGATGTVGAYLVRELSKRGELTRAAVHSEAKALKIREANVELFEMDFSKAATVDAALKGIEKLYLLTPFAPGQYETVGYVVKKAKESGVRYIVRQSALGSQSEAIRLFKTHRDIERSIEASGMDYTILRPNAFMQNFVNFFADSVRRQGKIFFPLSKARVSYIDARDIAHAAAELLSGEIKPSRSGKSYDLTGPSPMAVNDVAAMISKAIGKPVQYVDVSPEAARAGMKEAGMPEWAIEPLLELYAYQREGKGELVSTAVEDITGRRPIPFEEFIKDAAASFR